MQKEIEAFVEKKDGKLIAVASSESEDRMGDVLKVDGWDLKNFKKNPVLLFAHKYNEPPIGYAKNMRIEGKNLLFEPIFHNITQLSREIKSMFESEPPIMRAFSVGFIPKEFDKENKSIITKMELLEVSAVPVPANQEALIIAAKSFTDNDKVEIEKWLNVEIRAAETEIKSPECKKKDETKDECVARKIPEIMRDDPEMKQEQAVAIAFSMCDKLCKVEEIEEAHEGDKCTMDNGEMGEMHANDSGEMECTMPKKVAQEGDACTMDDGTDGEMMMSDGEMMCKPKKAQHQEGEKCTMDGGEEGEMMMVDGELMCKPKEKLEEQEAKESKYDYKFIKGAIAEEVAAKEDRQKKWENLDPVFKILDAFIGLYLDDNTPVEDFNKLLNETLGLLSNMSKSTAEIELKANQVLTTKNIKLVDDAIASLKQSVSVLQELRDATNESEPAVDGDSKLSKGRREEAHKPFQKNKVIVRALQEIAKSASIALHDAKQK